MFPLYHPKALYSPMYTPKGIFPYLHSPQKNFILCLRTSPHFVPMLYILSLHFIFNPSLPLFFNLHFSLTPLLPPPSFLHYTEGILQYNVELQETGHIPYQGAAILELRDGELILYRKDDFFEVVRWRLSHIRSFKAKKRLLTIYSGR